jgi:hypothetical protein
MGGGGVEPGSDDVVRVGEGMTVDRETFNGTTAVGIVGDGTFHDLLETLLQAMSRTPGTHGGD